MSHDGALKITTPSDREIKMIRAFDAPIDLVWEAFTTPELVRQWLLGPGGWTMVVCEMDLRVGGVYRHVLRRDKDGHEMGWGGVFREVVAPERLVATEQFEEAWYPGHALTTTHFAEQGGKTVVTQTMLLDTQEIRDGILKTGMEKGVAVSYDRLDQILASAPATRSAQGSASAPAQGATAH
jgi:uncharacterized protein YndB with AHSA1/START domain